MKFILSIISLSFFVSSGLFANVESRIFNKIERDLDSFIVKDLSKKELLFAKDEDKILRPASLTKIMTCILAIESKKMDNVVTITREMTEIEPTKLDLKVGEKVYLRDLVHAALIKSANDAANSIAYYLGDGDKEKFISMMNDKANNLGMTHTNFTNPCGFDAKEHKSSAKDLMKLTEYAIKNKTFNTIVKMNRYSFKSINTNKRYTVITSNKLQRDHKYIVGIKTGFTNGAGPCLIARAQKDKKDILIVMLNVSNRWKNADEAFNEAMKVKTAKQPKRSMSELFNS